MAAKSERLLALMDLLRQRRRPVVGAVLAEELGVSLRTLYRDIDALRAMGMDIAGEAGLGFEIRGSIFLPPLSLSSDEIEALTLGLRGQAHGPDAALQTAARSVLAKIGAVLPAGRRAELEASGLFSLPRPTPPDPHLGVIRQALREERVIDLCYRDRSAAVTRRLVWPVALGFLADRQDLIGWCTLRQDFRRFVTERMETVTLTANRLPEPRTRLLHRWRLANGLPDLS